MSQLVEIKTLSLSNRTLTRNLNHLPIPIRIRCSTHSRCLGSNSNSSTNRTWDNTSNLLPAARYINKTSSNSNTNNRCHNNSIKMRLIQCNSTVLVTLANRIHSNSTILGLITYLLILIQSTTSAAGCLNLSTQYRTLQPAQLATTITTLPTTQQEYR